MPTCSCPGPLGIFHQHNMLKAAFLAAIVPLFNDEISDIWIHTLLENRLCYIFGLDYLRNFIYLPVVYQIKLRGVFTKKLLPKDEENQPLLKNFNN